MSAETTSILTFALPREEAEDSAFDEKLAEAALALLAGGSVGFKLSTRVPASSLPPAKRRLYAVLRLLPEWLFVPPALAMQRGFYTDWNLLLADCETADDQILVMTVNRAKSAKAWDLPVECRPRDVTDRRRYLTLESVFGARGAVVCTPERRNRLIALLESLPAIDSRLRALEEEVRALKEEGADASEST